MSQSAIARELGCSQQNINRILRDKPTTIDVNNINSCATPIKRSKLGSTNVEYLIRRMKRDCPEVLNEIGDGKKYKSVQQAAHRLGTDRHS